MSDTSSTSDLSARVKTGFPLAAGIAILLFTPALVIGLAVLAVAFIGAQELTAMLSAKSDNSDTIVILPEWLLPGTAVTDGAGSTFRRVRSSWGIADLCFGLDIF